MNFIKAEGFVLTIVLLITELANASLSRLRAWHSAKYGFIVDIRKNVGGLNYVERAQHLIPT
jgi:hypothetical protein